MDLAEWLKADQFLFDVRLFEIFGTAITVSSLVTFLVVILATLWISRVVERAVLRVFRARGLGVEGTAGAAARLVHYIVLATGFGIAVHSVGINLTALFAAGAVFAVAIGFAMQNIAQNFVSGIILLLERTIKPGDVLEVDGRMVRVRDMGIRATIARTLDEEDLIIPNSELVVASVKNFTLRDALFRLRTEVGVVYSSDLAEVRRTLEATAADLDWRAKEVEPRILLKEFADSAVVFEVSIWIENPWNQQSRKSALNEALWWALKERGIVIAFPQVDVHFDPPVVESLSGLRRAV